jgi:hypothetical protein
MKVERLALALALLAVSMLAPEARARDEKTTPPLPWLLLSGNERKCTRFLQEFGGKVCLEWDTATRNFLLDRDGSVFLVVRTGHIDGNGSTAEPAVTSRSGRLAPPEIRSLRNLLANVGIATLRGNCDPFPGFDTVPFQEGAGYDLVWNGPGSTQNKIPLASTPGAGPVCPQGLLRILHRLNLISAGLPEAPTESPASNGPA